MIACSLARMEDEEEKDEAAVGVGREGCEGGLVVQTCPRDDPLISSTMAKRRVACSECTLRRE